MTNLYETGRKIGKYVMPTLAGLVLSFGNGCGKSENSSLPVSESTRIALEEKTNKDIELARGVFNKHVEYAVGEFNQTIEDGYFDLDEQRNVLRPLDLAQRFVEEHPNDLRFSEKDETLYDLLRENLEGHDVGVPNLEHELKRGGYDVEVEPSVNKLERTLGGIACASFMTLCFGFMGFVMYTVLAQEEKQENEKEKGNDRRRYPGRI